MGGYFPVQGYDLGSMTSGYGPRSSPTAGASSYHQGIDIAAPYGTPVVAPVNMTIISAGQSRGFGNLVQGIDDNGYTYQFGHLSQIGASVGQVLSAGNILGAVGSTGISTGNHLHFGIKDKDGNYIDPVAVAKGYLTSTKNKLKDAAGKAIGAIPGIGKPIEGVTDALGLTGECSLLCQIKNWISSTEIFQRIGIGMVALILIAAAFYLFGSNNRIINGQ